MEGSGSLPDGAFERFVTSALAAIITIVFSWRLLAEGQEQLEGNRPRLPLNVHEIEKKKEENENEENETIPLADIPVDDSPPVRNEFKSVEDSFQPIEGQTLSFTPKYATLDSESDNKCDEIDSPSWGDYSWEEDMYDTVHTRRKVKDFVVKRSSDSSSDEQDIESDIQLSPIPASHEMLEKLYMNQEYRSIDGEKLSDSSSDSDEEDDQIEGVYEPENIEDEMYYANGLEPIIEEDSDDFDSSENENEIDENTCQHVNATYNISPTENGHGESETRTVLSDNEPAGNIRQDLVKQTVTHNKSDVNTLQSYEDDTSSLPDLADDNQNLLDNFIDECFDNCDIDSNNDSNSSDSLPPSPIFRTRAIDEDNANLSDESCSSESVITVVSVKSDLSDTPEIQIVEDSNKPLSFIYTDNESNIPDNLDRENVLAFIHGSDTDLNKTPDNDTICEFQANDIEDTISKSRLVYEEFIKDIRAASEVQATPEGDKVEGESIKNVDGTAVDTMAPLQHDGEIELLIREDTDMLQAEKDNSIQSCTEADETNEISNENFEYKFDDDVGPREYNPYEDDFAEFEYCDSDDDSFYLVVGGSRNLPNFKTFNNGDSGNLRNFETFDNLDAVGLSPGLNSSCESGLSDDGRYIFSRTEDISTEYRTRFFTKDREMDPICENIDSLTTCMGIDMNVENKNTYNESKGHNNDLQEHDPLISELGNIELFIDEQKIAAVKNEEKEDISSGNSENILDFMPVEKAICDINYSPHENNETIIGPTKTISNSSISDKIDINGNSTDDGFSQSNDEKTDDDKDENGEVMSKSETGEMNKTPGRNNDEFISSKDEIDPRELSINEERRELETSLKPCIEILSKAHDSGIDLASESYKLDTTDSIKSISPGSTIEILDLLHNVKGQVDRSSAIKPSLLKGGTKTKVIQHQQKQRSKSYVSVLQQPITPEVTRNVALVLPERTLPKSRQQIISSRNRFLSEQNLTSNEMQDKFQEHRTSFEQISQRKPRYLRRGNSLPKSTRRRQSYEKLDFNSLNSSQSSIEKPEICKLHENCIFSPQKHEEILNRTLSIDNLEPTLMRYGSVASLVETDIDSGETTEYQIFTDFENDFEFQLPTLQRTASMSELQTRIKNRKETKGRFSDKNVPKSKSLCTLETNIDDIDDTPSPGTLGRVPSVHELRVSKSLQKLNVPDWYKKSSVSRSGSTWSLYSSPRKDSISSSYAYAPSITSSPCPSINLGSNSVVIRTRVTPSSARLFRTPQLQTTPEKSPTPISVQLPSDKLRQKEKPKELMPIPIVPFTKLRLMFEETSRKTKPTSLQTKPPSTSPVATPTTPVSPSEPSKKSQSVSITEKPTSKPIVPAKPILKKETKSPPENKNIGRVEPLQSTPVSVQPMSTSPRSVRRVETTFNGSVGQTEVRKAKETTFDGDKPIQVVKPKVQEQKVSPQISNTAENQNEHSSKSGRYSSLSKSLKSAFRRPQKPAPVESSGSKLETIV